MGDWFIGTTTSARKNDINRWLKGDIGKVYVWNRDLSDEEIKDIHKNVPKNKLVLKYDFNSELQKNSPYTAVDLSGNELHGSIRNCELKKGQVKIPYTIIPHRIPGKLKCLPHKDEGLVKNKDGKEVWAKGETTARNERTVINLSSLRYLNDNTNVPNTKRPITAPIKRFIYSVHVLTALKSSSSRILGSFAISFANSANPKAVRYRPNFSFFSTLC